MSVLLNLLPTDPYPYKGSVREQMRYLVWFAGRAPSIDESQPWRFRITDKGVDVLVDRSRLTIAADPDGRGALLSVGACLHHLMLAMRCYRLDPVLTYIPENASAPDYLATIHIVGCTRPTSEELELFAEMIRSDQTSSESFISEYALMKMRRAVVASGSGLIFVDGDWLANLVCEEEEGASKVSAQLAWALGGQAPKMAPPEFRGLNGSLDEPSGTMRLALGFLSFPKYGLDHRLNDASDGITSPAHALLYSACDSRNDVLEAGRCFGRLSLVAHHFGLNVRPCYELWDVPGLTERMREETSLAGIPQIVLRISSDGAEARAIVSSSEDQAKHSQPIPFVGSVTNATVRDNQHSVLTLR